ncbi:MAG: hypothetical protein R3185_06695, partial [Candidatus Thermoplasmatota archaeon]|nr:hypothetical protein [Candidatus Thermoplasmatota archaeon]
FFAWWATLAPLHRDEAGWHLTWPGSRLDQHRAQDPGEVALLVGMVYGVSFDGFLSTGLGQAALTRFAFLGDLGAFIIVLLLGFALFLAVFWTCLRWLVQVARTLTPPAELARRFAVSLLPIAAAYHLAHNVPYLLARLPEISQAINDPLGLGWHLLGAWSLPAIAWGEGTAKVVLALQMLTIVTGHVLAVTAAHGAAYRAFPSRLQALKSELPWTAVMVAYTMVGLYLVSGAGLTGGLG